jgi:mannose-1-phosphate guanylyltransferase
MAMKALLLSAGLGTRLRPYTNQLPKPCIPFFGVPLAYYSLFLLKQTNCREIAVNLHHLPEKIRELFARCPDKEFSFGYSFEESQPMGSGGALFYAKHLLADTDSFFAINSDEVFIPSRPDILVRLQEHHENTRSLLTLLVTDHPELGKTLKPIWVDSEGNVIAFGEKPQRPGVRPVHYTGCKIFSKDILPLLPSGESHIFHDTVVPAIQKGARVNTVFDPCQWWETGNFKSFLKATSDVIDLAAAGKAGHFEKVYRFLGEKFQFSISTGQAKIAHHKSVKLAGVKTTGTVFIDEGVNLSAGITLHNTLINSGAKIETSLTDQMIL